MHPSFYPNVLLKILKWPVATVALLALPAAIDALGESSLWTLRGEECEWLLYGAGAYTLGWLLVFRHAFSGSYVSTFEHELTHAIFAWATFHRVTGLKVTWKDGGVCTYEGSGGGNWLISIGPYWFPPLALLPAALIPLLDPSARDTLQFLTGFAGVYHLTSTWRETHLKQPDLQETSWVFAGMFLPTANLLTYGALTLFVTRGGDEALGLFSDVGRRVMALVNQVF